MKGLDSFRNAENRKILIVDDEAKNLKILRIKLGKDYELREASTAEEALEILKDFQPALILTDIMMPGMDGYELTRVIRENEVDVSPKIILLSGKSFLEEKLEGYNAGADDYLTKPFSGDELKAKINVFMRLYNLELRMFLMNSSLEEEVEHRTQELLKSERLAHLGMNAAHVAHNLKNPLTIIHMSIYRLKKKLGTVPEVESDFARLMDGYDRMLEAVKCVLNPLSSTKEEYEEFSIATCLEEELKFSVLGREEDLSLEVSLESNQLVRVSQSHFRQVLGNLINNSFEAMLESEIKKLFVTVNDCENTVEVRIRDTGSGIDELQIDKIFEPMFTTKDGTKGQVRGNGLGLAHAKNTIESFGGSIQLRNHPLGGAEVILKIPASSPSNMAMSA